MSNTNETRPPALTAAQRQANRQTRLKVDSERGRELRYQENSLNVLASEVLKFSRYVTIDLQAIDPARPFHSINDQLVYMKLKNRLEQQAGSGSTITKDQFPLGLDSTEEKPAPIRKRRDTPPKTADSVTPSKVSAKPRRTRERVGK